jgi:hypothetical protein
MQLFAFYSYNNGQGLLYKYRNIQFYDSCGCCCQQHFVHATTDVYVRLAVTGVGVA